MVPGLIIREAETDDVDTVLELWRRAGLEHHPRGRDSREALLEEVGSGARLLLAEVDGEAVATVLCTDDGRKGWVNRLAVLPECRNRGIAKAMLAEAERRLEARGMGMFCSMIYEDNLASRSLFEGVGYEAIPGVVYYRKKLRHDY